MNVSEANRLQTRSKTAAGPWEKLLLIAYLLVAREVKALSSSLYSSGAE